MWKETGLSDLLTEMENVTTANQSFEDPLASDQDDEEEEENEAFVHDSDEIDNDYKDEDDFTLRTEQFL